MRRQPGAVVFDVYNTLFHNDVEDWVDVFNDISSSQGLPIDGPTLYQRWKVLEVEFRKTRTNLEDPEKSPPFKSYEVAWGDCFQVIFRELGTGDAATAAKMAVRTMGEKDPFPETLHMLEVLRARTRVAILSNADDGYLLPLLRRYGLEFEVVLSSESVGAYKPHPKPFLQALDRLGLPPQETLYVGDNAFDDILGAHGVGMGTVWVNRNGQEYDTAYPAPDYTIADLRELIHILDGSK